MQMLVDVNRANGQDCLGAGKQTDWGKWDDDIRNSIYLTN